MAYTPVNVGTVANDNTGDPIRTAFQTINASFVTSDARHADDSTIDIAVQTIAGTAVDTDIVITPNGTGVIALDGISLPDSAAGDAAGAILASDGAGVLAFEVGLADLGEFTVAGLPAAASNASKYALATNASGGRTIVRSDGTDWKVVVVEGATVTV